VQGRDARTLTFSGFSLDVLHVSVAHAAAAALWQYEFAGDTASLGHQYVLTRLT
jgi:hypothetical protein